MSAPDTSSRPHADVAGSARADVADLARPLPRRSELGSPFWEAADRRELVRPVCNGCGRSFFTPQVACPHCWSQDWTWQQSSGDGTVYSSTVIHRGPTPEFEVPYELAIVDLDEGWSMLANILGGRPGVPTPIGTRVGVCWIQLAEGHLLPAFTEVSR